MLGEPIIMPRGRKPITEGVGTIIRVKHETRDRLKRHTPPGASYDFVLRELLAEREQRATT